MIFETFEGYNSAMHCYEHKIMGQRIHIRASNSRQQMKQANGNLSMKNDKNNDFELMKYQMYDEWDFVNPSYQNPTTYERFPIMAAGGQPPLSYKNEFFEEQELALSQAANFGNIPLYDFQNNTQAVGNSQKEELKKDFYGNREEISCGYIPPLQQFQNFSIEKKNLLNNEKRDNPKMNSLKSTFGVDSSKGLSFLQQAPSVRGIVFKQNLFSSGLVFGSEDRNLQFNPILKSQHRTAGSTRICSFSGEHIPPSKGDSISGSCNQNIMRSQYQISVQPSQFRLLGGQSLSLRQMESLRRLKKYKKKNLPSLESLDNFEKRSLVGKCAFHDIDEIEFEGEEEEFGSLKKAEI